MKKRILSLAPAVPALAAGETTVHAKITISRAPEAARAGGVFNALSAAAHIRRENRLIF
jgi:hypothetical protein